MKTAIMQPYFFPYLGYWQLINAVDTFVIFDDVNFIKKGWINRNNILLNKAPHRITFPLKGISQNILIKDVSITDEPKAKQDLLKTIKLAYSKAPYFEYIFPILEPFFLKNNITISTLNYEIILEVLKYLNINKTIVFSSSIEKDNSKTGQDKILEICKKLGTTLYINAIGGQELYDKNIFAQNNIQLNFIKMSDIKYQQFNNEFVPNLSIIDVLMFNPPEKIREMFDDYELI